MRNSEAPKSKIFAPDIWENFDYNDKTHQRQLMGALQMFASLPNKFVPSSLSKVEEFVKAHKQLQEFTLMSDGWANEKAIAIAEKFHLTPDYDNGYEQIFDVRDYSASQAAGFDVAGVTTGLTFGEVKPGEKAKVFEFAGDKYRCYFCTYAAALGWHRQLFEDGDWWTIEDNAIAFRDAAYSSRAGIYYALLEAAMDQNGCCKVVASDCSDCSADARSVADSINYAAKFILESLANRGYGLSPQTTEFIVLTPLAMRGRVRQALAVTNQQYAGSPAIIDYNFRMVTSMMLTHANRVAVILPKRTIKAGYRQDLTLFNDFDILSYTDTVAGWMRHGGCIGDLEQIACIEFTATSGSCPTSSTIPLATCGHVVDANGEPFSGGLDEQR
jgi:hypothetical protein